MVSFSPDSQSALREVLEEMNGDVRYVVLNGWRTLPSSTPGNDIDLFVTAKDLETATRICSRAGFAAKGERVSNRVTKYVELAQKTVDSPSMVANVIRENGPIETMKKLYDPYYPIGDDPLEDVHRVSLRYFDMKLDLVNHLAYHSVQNDDRKRRINPEVEEILLADRRLESGIYVPGRPSEIVHLACCIVFDYPHKAKRLPDYYGEQLAHLFDSLDASQDEPRRLRELLYYVFYDANEHVFELLQRGAYRELKPELERFAEY